MMTPLTYLVAREHVCDEIERAAVRAVPEEPRLRPRLRRAFVRLARRD